MIILTNKNNAWGDLADSVFYGQKGEDIICETNEVPGFAYTEVTEEYSDFEQRCVRGTLFQSIFNGVIRTHRPSVAELKIILDKINFAGEKARDAETLGELNLLVQLTDAERRADEQDLLLFEIIMGGGIV